MSHPKPPIAQEKNAIRPATLYLVATPIGNLSDLSERAVKVLSEVDFIAAEDTRNTAKLLTHLGLKKEMVSYFEHNKKQRGEEILARLSAGESCALVTDAGMPAISDPGEDMVSLCAEAGIETTCIPGCCAAVTALALSALPTGRFSFEGFLPVKGGEREKRLQEMQADPHTLILYEAPHRLRGTLNDLLTFLGDRRISLCRELTKLNEEVRRTTIARAAEFYRENEPRGEYVLVIEGAAEAPAGVPAWSDMTPEDHVRLYLDQGMKKMDAIKAAAKDRGMAKSDFYRLVAESDL